ncbi:MAG: 2-oxo acid dehydrogenase subunit E2 [Verrucomicrobiia bacterium]|jgi:pyruvate dehydrogenase E2 component (dihydrolipoamide acetyltransferase)
MDIRLPRLGEGAESGTVVSVFVRPGDQIKEGQTIVELENEKAVAPIPASAAGRVAKVYVKEGDKISVGQPILALTNDSAVAATSATDTPREGTRPTTLTAPAPARRSDRPTAEVPSVDFVGEPVQNESVAASPTVRKLAHELGIDLSRVRGTESGGRIGLEDLRGYVRQLQQRAFGPGGAPSAGAPAPKPTVERIDFEKWGPVSRKPVSSLRKIIAQRMRESWVSVPRVTQFDEADVTGVVALRKKYVAKYEKKGGHLTLTPFLMRAVVVALKKYPIFNSSLDEATEEIVFKSYYHMGIAVDTEQGLIVPVIRDVDRKNLLQLSKELSDMAEKTRQRKVAADELKGGTFTISNQGGIGGGFFTPIVNKPEVAVLGVGRGALKPVVRGEKIEKRMMLPLGLSYDHRVIDGATAARFIVEIVHALEQFKEADVKV